MELPVSGTNDQYTPNQPRIADRCPNCGAQSLFIGGGGWLSCSVIGCSNPSVRDAIAALKAPVFVAATAMLVYELHDVSIWVVRARDPRLAPRLQIWQSRVMVGNTAHRPIVDFELGDLTGLVAKDRKSGLPGTDVGP